MYQEMTFLIINKTYNASVQMPHLGDFDYHHKG
jgi:hypothetical protein